LGAVHEHEAGGMSGRNGNLEPSKRRMAFKPRAVSAARGMRPSTDSGGIGCAEGAPARARAEVGLPAAGNAHRMEGFNRFRPGSCGKADFPYAAGSRQLDRLGEGANGFPADHPSACADRNITGSRASREPRSGGGGRRCFRAVRSRSAGRGLPEQAGRLRRKKRGRLPLSIRMMPRSVPCVSPWHRRAGHGKTLA
jgi:hypothetical protein